MSSRKIYLTHQFNFVRGELVEVRRVIFPSSPGAVSRAEHDAAWSVGVVAVEQTVDTETGEVLEEPVVLAKFGELPKEFDGK